MTARTPNGIPSWGFEHEQPDHGGLERWEEQSAEDYAPTSQPDPAWREYVDGLGQRKGAGATMKTDIADLSFEVDTSGIDAATKALERFIAKLEEAKGLAADAGVELDFDEGAIKFTGPSEQPAEDLRLILGMNDALLEAAEVSCNGRRVEGCFVADEINGHAKRSMHSSGGGRAIAHSNGPVEIRGLTDEQRREHRARYAERYR